MEFIKLINPIILNCGLIAIIASILIFARRWKNPDADAGYGIAGWAIAIIIIYLISTTTK